LSSRLVPASPSLSTTISSSRCSGSQSWAYLSRRCSALFFPAACLALATGRMLPNTYQAHRVKRKSGSVRRRDSASSVKSRSRWFPARVSDFVSSAGARVAADSAPNTYRGSLSVLRRCESAGLSRPRNTSVPSCRPIQVIDVACARSLSPGSGEGQSRIARGLGFVGSTSGCPIKAKGCRTIGSRSKWRYVRRRSAARDRIEFGPSGLSLDNGLTRSAPHVCKNFSGENTVPRARM